MERYNTESDENRSRGSSWSSDWKWKNRGAKKPKEGQRIPWQNGDWWSYKTLVLKNRSKDLHEGELTQKDMGIVPNALSKGFVAPGYSPSKSLFLSYKARCTLEVFLRRISGNKVYFWYSPLGAGHVLGKGFRTMEFLREFAGVSIWLKQFYLCKMGIRVAPRRSELSKTTCLVSEEDIFCVLKIRHSGSRTRRDLLFVLRAYIQRIGDTFDNNKLRNTHQMTTFSVFDFGVCYANDKIFFMENINDLFRRQSSVSYIKSIESNEKENKGKRLALDFDDEINEVSGTKFRIVEKKFLLTNNGKEVASQFSEFLFKSSEKCKSMPGKLKVELQFGKNLFEGGFLRSFVRDKAPMFLEDFLKKERTRGESFGEMDMFMNFFRGYLFFDSPIVKAGMKNISKFATDLKVEKSYKREYVFQCLLKRINVKKNHKVDVIYLVFTQKAGIINVLEFQSAYRLHKLGILNHTKSSVLQVEYRLNIHFHEVSERWSRENLPSSLQKVIFSIERHDMDKLGLFVEKFGFVETTDFILTYDVENFNLKGKKYSNSLFDIQVDEQKRFLSPQRNQSWRIVKMKILHKEINKLLNSHDTKMKGERKMKELSTLVLHFFKRVGRFISKGFPCVDKSGNTIGKGKTSSKLPSPLKQKK